MKIVYKYLKLEAIIFKLSLLQLIEYRLDALIGFISSLLWISGFMLTLEIIFRNIPLIAQWDKWDLIIMFGISQLYAGFFFLATQHNMQILSDDIKNGKFDTKITRPLNTLIYGTLSRFNLHAGIVFPIEFIGIILYASSNKNYDIDLVNILTFLFTFFLTCIIGHAINIIFTSINFWITDSMMQEAYIMTNDITPYPMEVIENKYLRIFFLTVLPYALLINVPFRALIGELPLWMFVLQIIVTLSFVVVMNIVWNKGLKAYQSASS